MESFLVSLSTVAIAEIGDRTQLLSLMLAARYRRPWPILAGVLCATLANHAVAGIVGVRLGRYLTPTVLDAVVGVSMIGMALWTLKPDTLDESKSGARRASTFLSISCLRSCPPPSSRRRIAGSSIIMVSIPSA